MQNFTIPNDLISYMEMQFETLPLFKELKTGLKPLDLKHFEKFNTILIFGIGGSSLGGQAIYAMSNLSKDIRFIDNIDPKTFLKIFEDLNLQETGVFFISKSGNTAEPLMQLMLTKQIYEKVLPDTWAFHFAVLTEPKENALNLFAKEYGLLTIDHPIDIGGRYNVFTSVGHLIAKLTDFDFTDFKEGARSILKSNLNETLQGACRFAHLHMDLNINQSVLMVYADALELFGQWYAQLWAESLGKCHVNGRRFGITPICALGVVDQHSQLQLYADGPRDKMITFITVKNHFQTDKAKSVRIQHPAFQTLEGKTMGELFKAEERGTIDTLKATGCHVREFEIESLTPYYLGKLMSHFMVETIATAYLLDINPFDQPGVEESKIRAMEYLKA